MRLTDNTVLISGGATGIGRGLARCFLARGNRVWVCSNRQDDLDGVASELPGLEVFLCDVTRKDERARLFDAIRDAGAGLNVLINNAARMRNYRLGAPEPEDAEELRSDVLTNLVAPMEMVAEALPLLEGSGDGAPGTVVNVCSPAGLVPVASVPIYSACKAGLHSYSLSLRHQLEGRVEVIVVFPPTVDTQMAAGVNLDKVSVDAYVEELFPRLAKGQPEIWSGQGRILPVLQRLSPGRTFSLVNRTAETS